MNRAFAILMIASIARFAVAGVAPGEGDHDVVPGSGISAEKGSIRSVSTGDPYQIKEFKDCGEGAEYPAQADGSRLWSKWVNVSESTFSRGNPSFPESQCAILVVEKNGLVRGMLLPFNAESVPPKVTMVSGAEIGRLPGKYVMAPFGNPRDPVEFILAPCTAQIADAPRGAGFSLKPVSDSYKDPVKETNDLRAGVVARKGP